MTIVWWVGVCFVLFVFSSLFCVWALLVSCKFLFTCFCCVFCCWKNWFVLCVFLCEHCVLCVYTFRPLSIPRPSPSDVSPNKLQNVKSRLNFHSIFQLASHQRGLSAQPTPNLLLTSIGFLIKPEWIFRFRFSQGSIFLRMKLSELSEAGNYVPEKYGFARLLKNETWGKLPQVW